MCGILKFLHIVIRQSLAVLAMKVSLIPNNLWMVALPAYLYITTRNIWYQYRYSDDRSQYCFVYLDTSE